jgi:hypothetical protein
MRKQELTVGSSITESYQFLAEHMPHFFRLIYGPLFLWVLAMLSEQILAKEYGIQIKGNYFLHLFTASFAIVWYRQFLLGSDKASYRLLFKNGFSETRFTARRFGRALLRITVITLALLVPTLIVSTSIMIYYLGQGMQLSESIIQELSLKSTFIVMVAFSPILVRLSLFTAGFALGRTSLGFRQVWKQTRGYTVTLWWVALRGFLPLAIYSYVLTWFLGVITQKLSVNYIISTILIESLAGFLTFMMLAIVVAANAEAFRILIGVRDGDTPHREDSGLPRAEKQTI